MADTTEIVWELKELNANVSMLNHIMKAILEKEATE